MSDSQPRPLHDWILDLTVGGLVGAVLAGIVAWNLLIYSGVEGGYQAGIGDAFRHNFFVGVGLTVVLAAGPVLGVVYARRRRSSRAARATSTESAQPSGPSS